MSHFYPEVHLARVRELQQRLPKEIVRESVPFTALCAVTPEPVPFAERLTLDYRPIREGEIWGGTWDCGWFHIQADVPASWKGAYVTARLDCGGEILVFDGQGDPLVGLTNGSVFDGHFNKDTVHLLPRCRGGEHVDLWLETGANGLFGVNRPADPAWVEDPSKIHGTYTGSVRSLRLCRFDPAAWQLWIDLQVLENLVGALPETSARRTQLLRVMSKALDVYAREGAAACRAALKPAFAVTSDPSTVDVYGVGHAHIDTAWLWPFRETVRKCGRTFASQIRLIERYPGYVFGASQAQLYAFTKKHYPSLYARIKQAVADGRWEVQGGMWVEADCNLIGGESMVRQFVHGKNFFRDEFGVDVKNLWLPDVFGYSGNLPQILRRGGMDFFLTQKMSWNWYNKFPHNTFIWRGIDGSEVLAHFPPEDTYNANVIPSELRRNESNNQERGLVNEAICLFGIGDGGGGPKEEHVERALRLRDLNGVPRFHFGHAQRVLEKMATYRDDLSTWSGELYFELHRGTLTTQAATKRWNRRAEEALRAAEMVCAAAGLRDYPAADFDALWKTLLVNQFHDIIPGSSINRVYAETVPMLQDVVTRAQALQAAAARKLLKPARDTVSLFNPSTTAVAVAVKLPEGWTSAFDARGRAVPVQVEADGAVAWVETPGQGFATLRRGTAKARAAAVASAKTAGTRVLENALIRYEFDAGMQLVRAFDKQAGVELVRPGQPANSIDLYDDHPHTYDAWDIDEYYATSRVGSLAVQSIRRVTGPVRCGLQVVATVGESSTVRQQVWLNATGKRLDFVTEVDWREKHKLLRVAFPTTIAADRASAEIQYGFVSRPTTDNTKWEHAQFEAVGHRYVDLSRADYGAALLNDSKYGYRAKGHSLELSLLRSPTEPDPIADRGQQLFTYSFLPHTGALIDSDVQAHAAALNQGVECFPGLAATAATKLPVALSGAGLELAVLKRAEKENALVVRIVETRGQPARGTLTARNPRARIVETDLIEWHATGAKATGKVALELGPFEIRTYKIQLAY